MARITPICLAVTMFIASASFTTVFAKNDVEATGPDVNATLNINNVTEIVTSQAITVSYTVGPNTSVRYSTPESIAPYLDITCTDGTLSCSYTNGTNIHMKGRQTVVYVTAPTVDEFKASSAGSIVVAGTVKTAELEAEASSAGSITIESAMVNEAELKASSSGSITINSLTAQHTEAKASSSGTITLNGNTNELEGGAASSGTINFSGSCATIEAQASSSGTINATKAKIGSGTLKASSSGEINVAKAQKSYSKTASSGGSVNIR